MMGGGKSLSAALRLLRQLNPWGEVLLSILVIPGNRCVDGGGCADSQKVTATGEQKQREEWN
jgi:hypothetical protein